MLMLHYTIATSVSWKKKENSSLLIVLLSNFSCVSRKGKIIRIICPRSQLTKKFGKFLESRKEECCHFLYSELKFQCI